MNNTLATAIATAALAMPLANNAAERAVDKTAIIPAPVDAVWNAWTTTEGVKSFFAPDAKVEARVDGPFEIYFNPFAPPGLKGADGMRFLALQERKMVSFTWNAPPHLPEARSQRTYVTVRMKPVNETQTQVTLHHGGWGEGAQWDQAFTYFDRAWGAVLANLQKRFVEHKPIDWSAFLERLKAQAEKATTVKP